MAKPVYRESKKEIHLTNLRRQLGAIVKIPGNRHVHPVKVHYCSSSSALFPSCAQPLRRGIQAAAAAAKIHSAGRGERAFQVSMREKDERREGESNGPDGSELKRLGVEKSRVTSSPGR